MSSKSELQNCPLRQLLTYSFLRLIPFKSPVSSRGRLHEQCSVWRPNGALQMSMHNFAPAGVLHLKQSGYQQRKYYHFTDDYYIIY